MCENAFLTEPARILPVQDACDVLVCGGGIAGIAAALAAARTGAKVTLLEREYVLGGLATLGLVTIYLPLCDGNGRQVSYGIAEELLKCSIRRGIIEGGYNIDVWLRQSSIEERSKQRYLVQYNPHLFALDAEQLLCEAGVHILYGTLAAGVIQEESRITAVVIENKSGRSAIPVKSVVDATGDADICKLAGAECVLSQAQNTLAAWYYRISETEGYKLKPLGFAELPGQLRERGVSADNLHTRRYSGVNGPELSEMTVDAHRKISEDIDCLRQQDPTAIPITLPTVPQVRMTRQIRGLASPDFSLDHRHTPTSIGMVGNWRERGPVYELPFECLYGADVPNLITAGRNISCTEDMWEILRVIPVCAVTGQAAGTAAALSNDFGQLNVEKLQHRLQKDGVRLHQEQL